MGRLYFISLFSAADKPFIFKVSQSEGETKQVLMWVRGTKRDWIYRQGRFTVTTLALTQSDSV